MKTIVFIHGIADQTTGYSNKLYDNILHYSDRSSKVLKQKEIMWADVTHDLTCRFNRFQYVKPKKKGKSDKIKKGIDPLVLQVLYYAKDKKKQNDILARVHSCMAKLRGDVVVIAHSLGSVIMFDYLMGFANNVLPANIKVSHFITMGSPIPLFVSGHGHCSSNLTLPSNVEKWTNIIDPDDCVANWCEPHFAKGVVEDKYLNVGAFPLSTHGNYWSKKKVAKFIAEVI